MAMTAAADTNATVAPAMECKFLDSYEAGTGDETVRIWHCRKRDPFVLGDSKAAALATCASCRLGDFTRPPAELAAEVARRNQELVALNAIVTAVNASLDLDTVLSMGLEKVIEIVQADAGWVSLAGADGYRLAGSQSLSRQFAEATSSRRRGEGFVGMIAEKEETVVVESTADFPDVRREGFTTLIGVPLKAQGEMLAVLAVGTRTERNYSADDIYFVTAAGAQLAAAIERALLFREQAARIDRERRLLEASETVNRNLDSPSLRMVILSEAARLVDAEKSALLAVRGEHLVAEAVYRLSDDYRRLFIVPIAGSLSGRAVTDGVTVAAEDVDDEPLADGALVSSGGYRAFMTAPLQSYRGTDGALTVYFDAPTLLSDDTKTLLRTFAVQAAVALDNQRLMREKDQLAAHDGLTGVFNRTYLEMALERTAKDLRRYGGTASVLFLDVDGLKLANDTDGHSAGDLLLRDMAAVLLATCRESDIVTRYGGDEFVVLMPSTDEEGAQHVADKVIEGMAERNRHQTSGPRLSASLGIHTADGAGVGTLLREADRRMYAMKRTRQRD
jgi:diguanylate cyclase (GGDEF)-like protein